ADIGGRLIRLGDRCWLITEDAEDAKGRREGSTRKPSLLPFASSASSAINLPCNAPSLLHGPAPLRIHVVPADAAREETGHDSLLEGQLGGDVDGATALVPIRRLEVQGPR